MLIHIVQLLLIIMFLICVLGSHAAGNSGDVRCMHVAVHHNVLSSESDVGHCIRRVSWRRLCRFARQLHLNGHRDHRRLQRKS